MIQDTNNIINLNLVQKQNVPSLLLVLHNPTYFCFEKLTPDVANKPASLAVNTLSCNLSLALRMHTQCE